MSVSLLVFVALLGGGDMASPVTQGTAQATQQAGKPSERFANRPQARIPFARQIQNFQVKREDNDDILYLETSRNRWYRSEIGCFGISDPRDAQGILPIDRSGSFDSASRVILVGFSHQRNDCTVRSLIELTPEEATSLRLIRGRAARPKASSAPVPAPAN
jgi:hypothetical protein